MRADLGVHVILIRVFTSQRSWRSRGRDIRSEVMTDGTEAHEARLQTRRLESRRLTHHAA
jgi:hypothetical protein